MLTIGSPAPDFAVLDDQGNTRRLADFAGKTLVLWFYPKADTPGCTAEGKGFRDLQAQLDAKNVVVVGASFDSVANNRSFRDKCTFPFPLLCDTTKELGIAYGAADDTSAGNPRRITIVVGPDGKVARVYPKVDARTHPQQVLDDLG